MTYTLQDDTAMFPIVKGVEVCTYVAIYILKLAIYLWIPCMCMYVYMDIWYHSLVK